MSIRAAIRKRLRLPRPVNRFVWLIFGIGTVGLLALAWGLAAPVLYSNPRPELPRTRFIPPAAVEFEPFELILAVDRENNVWCGKTILDNGIEGQFERHRARSTREGQDYGPVLVRADFRAEWRALRSILVAAAKAGIRCVDIEVRTGGDSTDHLTLVLMDAEPPGPNSGSFEKEIWARTRRKFEIHLDSAEASDQPVREAGASADGWDRLAPRIRLELDPRASIQDVVSLLECYGKVLPLVGLK